jgi:molecular chaperone IbpA
MTHLSLPYGKSLLPSTVGFDRLLSTFEEFDNLLTHGAKVQSYPPYNILKEDDENYTIEIAVSGFKRDEIEITSEGGKLYVNGSIKTTRTSDKYLHRGIGTRDFSHKFVLSDTIVVKDADITDGLLVINLVNIIPEEKKPRKIDIGCSKNTTEDLTK